MKKLIAYTGILMMLALCIAPPALAEAESTLVVGHTTKLSGSFFTEMWGNNTADMDVRELIHGYPTVVTDEEWNILENRSVIRSLQRELDADGNTVFSIRIRDSLTYSDGSPIKASDYAFAMLLEASPVIREIGGKAVARKYIVGAAAYADGANSTFSGLHLIDDYTFSITVAREAFPYFYELYYVYAQPYPIAAIAPGCTIRDDGEGAYIDGDFTADLLRETILNPETGYLSHPQVSSGPYVLSAFDLESGVAVFRINPYFAGDYRGTKPRIKSLIFREVKNSTLLDELRSGSVGLVNKISSGDVIDQLGGLRTAGVANYQAYPRRGLGYIAFTCEQGYASSVLLRQAVAHIVDKSALARDYLHGYGQPVFGFYGQGQWMAMQRKDDLPALNIYPYNIAEAERLLQQDGWTLNSQGEPYAQGDGQRYRQEGEALLPLMLSIAITPDNEAAVYATDQLKESFAAVGGELQVSVISMAHLLEHYYRQMDRKFDMFFLGSNFPQIFDPTYFYSPDPNYQGAYNTSGLTDENLFRLAKEMRETPKGNTALYLDRWLAFQKAWVELLPLLPLYSNTYYDAYTPRLSNYQPQNYNSWASAILYATLAD